MAIGTPTTLLVNGSGTDSTSYTSDAFTPPASRLLLLFVSSALSAGGTPPSSIVDSRGITWNLILQDTGTAGSLNGAWYWANSGPSPTSGTIQINFAVARSSCQWHVHDVVGADLNNPIVQSGSGSLQNLDNPSVALAALQPGSITLGACVWNNTIAVPPGSGYTTLSDSPSATGPATLSSVEYKNPGSATVGWTLTQNLVKAYFGIEVRAASSDLTPRLIFDDLADGDTITTAALPTGWTVDGTGGTLTALALAAAHGSVGARFANPTVFRRFIYNTSGTGQACQTMYFRIRQAGAGVIYPSGGTGTGNWRINANLTTRVRNNNTAIGSDSAALSLNTLYRAEHTTNPGAGTQTLNIFAGDAITPIITHTGALVGTSRTNFQFGATAAAAGWIIDIDSAWVADGPTGPYTEGGGPPPVGPPPTLTFPSTYAAHRADTPGPANTIAGWQQADLLSPTSVMDVDVQRLADGTYVCCHDTTIDGLVHATSPIQTGEVDTDFTAAQWATIRFKNADNSGWALASTFDQVIAAYGPSGSAVPNKVMSVEYKTTSPGYQTFIDYLTANGMKPQVMFCSFSANAVAAAVASGYYTQRIWSGTPTQADVNALAAGGVEELCINVTTLTATPAILTWAHAAGMRLSIFTVNDTPTASGWITSGVDLIYTDVPGVLNPGTVTYAGAAALSATSTLSAAGVRGRPATASLAATSTLTAAAVPARAAAVALTATSTLTAAAVPGRAATAALSATSTLLSTATNPSLTALETATIAQQNTNRADAAARVAAATTFTETWATTPTVGNWPVGTATVLAGNRMYSTGAIARSLPGTRFTIRTTLRTTGVAGKFAYIGVGPTGLAPANCLGIGVSSGGTGPFINRGANIAAGDVVVPRAFPGSLAAGEYLLTISGDDTHISLTIQALNSAQAVYGARVARSAFPAAPAMLFINNNDTAANGMQFGPLVAYSDLLPPPAASRTLAGFTLYGANKPLVHLRTNNGIGHLIAYPGDMDTSAVAPLVLYAHQSLSGTAMTWLDDTRMAGLLTSLHNAGYVVCSSDNGPGITPGGTQDRYGNQAGLDDYANLVSWARSVVATGNLFLLGASMGTYFVLNMIHRREVGNIGAAAVISGNPNLSMALDNVSYRPLLLAAYGATDDVDFGVKVVGYDPVDEPSVNFRGLPIAWYEGTSDTLVGDLAVDVQPFIDRLSPLAPEMPLTTAPVGHLDASLYQGADVTAFFNKYTTYPTGTQPGAATLSATSTLTAAAVRQPVASAALTATSTLTATGVRARLGTAALTAASTLTATGVRARPAAASLTATSTLTATGVAFSTLGGSVTLTATSTLSGVGVVTEPAAADLTATSTLTVAGVRVPVAAVALTATSTLSATAVRVPVASAGLVAVATLSAAAVRAPVAAVALSATSTLTTTGLVTKHATVALTATSTLSGAATRAVYVAPPMSDTFDGPFDTAKWPNGYGAMSTVGGRLRAPHGPPSWPAQAESAEIFDLNTAPLNIEFTTLQNTGNGSTMAQFTVGNDLGGAALSVRREADGTPYLMFTGSGMADGTYTGWDASGDRWLRMRATAADLLFETAPDNATWTTRHTVPRPAWVDSLASVSIGGGYWGTETNPGYSEWDNFNVQPAPAALTATSTLTAGGAVTQPAAAALTATSTLTTTGVRSTAAAASLVATSTLTGTGVRVRVASAALTATSTLTSTGRISAPAAAALVAASTLSATGVRGRVGAAVLTAASTLTVGAVITEYASVALVATSTLTGDGVTTEHAAAALIATSTLAAEGLVTEHADVDLTATSTLSISATVEQPAAVALVATSTLSATAVRVRVGAVVLSATSTLGATAVRGRPAAVALTATSTLTATGVRARIAAAALTATSTLTATGVRDRTAAVDLVATSILSAAGEREVLAAVVLVATSTLYGDGDRVTPNGVDLEATSTLSVSAGRATYAAVALVAASTLTTAGVVTEHATVTLTAGSTLTATGLRVVTPTAALTAAAVLSVAGTRSQPAQVALSAASSLVVGATPVRPAAAALSASAVLTVAAAAGAEISVALVAVSTLTGDGLRAATVSAALAATSTLIVGTHVEIPATVALSAAATLSTAGVVVKHAAAALVAASTLTVGAYRGRFALAALQSTSTLLAAAAATQRVTAALIAVSTLTVAGGRALSAAVDLTAAADLSADGVPARRASVDLDATSTLSSTGDREVRAAVVLLAQATLVAEAVAEILPTVSLTAFGTLLVSALRAAVADAQLTSTSTLVAAGIAEPPPEGFVGWGIPL